MSARIVTIEETKACLTKLIMFMAFEIMDLDIDIMPDPIISPENKTMEQWLDASSAGLAEQLNVWLAQLPANLWEPRNMEEEDSEDEDYVPLQDDPEIIQLQETRLAEIQTVVSKFLPKVNYLVGVDAEIEEMIWGTMPAICNAIGY